MIGYNVSRGEIVPGSLNCDHGGQGHPDRNSKMLELDSWNGWFAYLQRKSVVYCSVASRV